MVHTNVEFLDATGKTGADAVWRPGGLLRDTVSGPSRLIDLPYQDSIHDNQWDARNPYADNAELKSDWTGSPPRNLAT